ncbi:DUF3450 family protein [Pelagicoccus sp. SDUM812003]|uniref:DUF3450 family protein n=1 Tax=Pelagicoccus sp. SDUM812003 TaxID=3041267 RepID=UPI00280DD3E3|nr:DUF3450 family protein [Pelagicoccus sp. SDUM812003]MDQ8204698.1 DUF3450 family protein [Pelagicoccus sp. SDUM812003]
MNNHLRTLIGGTATLCALIGLNATAAELDDTRSTFIEWSKVQSQISKESTDWKNEEALLNDMIDASKAELESISKRIEELENSSTEADEKRAELSEKIEEAKATAALLEEAATSYEGVARSVVPLLPEPLKMDIQPLIQRLPKDAEAAKKAPLSQRIQTVVGILTQVEKFHSQISMVSEIKEVEPGVSKEVKTIYFGLSVAYYADANAENAGYGHPTPEGWTWTTVAGDEAMSIADAIAIHSNDAPPAFVTLPIEIL